MYLFTMNFLSTLLTYNYYNSLFSKLFDCKQTERKVSTQIINAITSGMVSNKTIIEFLQKTRISSPFGQIIRLPTGILNDFICC